MKRDFKGIWIPKAIWINKDLTLIEKMFLVEIDSLDNENSCFASNAYFSEFFGVSKGRCSQIIKSLRLKGIIDIELEYKGKEVVKRLIRVVNKLNTPIKNIKGGYLENDKDSNTLNNNTLNNKEKGKPTEKEILRTALKKQIGRQQFLILEKNESDFTGLGQPKFKLLIDWLEWKKANKPYKTFRGLNAQVLSHFKIYDLPKIKRVVNFAMDKEHSGLNWPEDYKGQINYKNGSQPKPEVLKAAPSSFVSPSSI